MDGEPTRGEPRDPSELSTVDRFGGRDERARAPGLHLDEHELRSIAADEVDLAEARTRVASDDAHPAPQERRLGRALAGESKEGPAVHVEEIGRRLR